MLRLRFWIACLLMAALPLQGLAAVSMMLCGGAAAAAGTHEHQAHEAAAAGADAADHALDAHAVHSQAGHGHAASDEGSAPADADHRCGICGAGCHSVAITSSPPAMQPSIAPQSIVAAPAPTVLSRTTPVPERPPRA